MTAVAVFVGGPLDGHRQTFPDADRPPITVEVPVMEVAEGTSWDPEIGALVTDATDPPTSAPAPTVRIVTYHLWSSGGQRPRWEFRVPGGDA